MTQATPARPTVERHRGLRPPRSRYLVILGGAFIIAVFVFLSLSGSAFARGNPNVGPTGDVGPTGEVGITGAANTSGCKVRPGDPCVIPGIVLISSRSILVPAPLCVTKDEWGSAGGNEDGTNCSTGSTFNPCPAYGPTGQGAYSSAICERLSYISQESAKLTKIAGWGLGLILVVIFLPLFMRLFSRSGVGG